MSGMNPLINSLSTYVSSFGVFEYRFDHDSDGVSLVSGIDTRDNVSQGFFTCNGPAWTVGPPVGPGFVYPQNLTCLVFLCSTATMVIGSNKQISIIL